MELIPKYEQRTYTAQTTCDGNRDPTCLAASMLPRSISRAPDVSRAPGHRSDGDISDCDGDISDCDGDISVCDGDISDCDGATSVIVMATSVIVAYLD
ncbi:hypothetical protein MAR_037912 [Mya arenaria]|uniref:Uncharacterized protein n=1 Tax=Mya arenaria TaxID=6604 RepID=A0ABY7FPV1_MYAAR|nr:hypothetical protein MAR_037912 [Mya arenaria]